MGAGFLRTMVKMDQGGCETCKEKKNLDGSNDERGLKRGKKRAGWGKKEEGEGSGGGWRGSEEDLEEENKKGEPARGK